MKKAIFFMLSIGFYGCGFEVVDVGNRGIRIELGKVIGDPLTEGLYFYNPFTSQIKEISVREEKREGKAECFTKDTQHVSVNFTFTYYPDPTQIGAIYKQFGETWESKIIDPAILGSMKDAIAQYNADELVGKREQAKNSIFKELDIALKGRSVISTRLDLTNLDFDDAYEKAVEDKVVAVQLALGAKNQTVTVQENAKQTVIAAQADAESMKIRSAALAQSKSLVEYEAVKKWNGVLPTQMLGGAVPFINVAKKE